MRQNIMKATFLPPPPLTSSQSPSCQRV